jgi:hypothetical protein
LVDVGVGKQVEAYLLEKRYDTKAVRSLDQRMPDQEIIRLAALEKCIVITMPIRLTQVDTLTGDSGQWWVSTVC